MTPLKLRPVVLCFVLFVAIAGMVTACNDSAKKAESSAASSSDTIDTSKMDTATTRPVKTTN